MAKITDKPVTNSTRGPFLLMVVLFACVIANQPSKAHADCKDIAAPGVNWSGCDKSEIEKALTEDTADKPFYEWVKNITLDGSPFTYDRHEYLIEPYKDTHPHQVEQKAAQMGLTSKAMLKVAYGARYGGYRGILYLFPSKSDVTDFSKGSINPPMYCKP